MTGHLVHERERLVKLVDNFIDSLEENFSPEVDPRIDEIGVCAIIAASDNQDSSYGHPMYLTETSRPHVQLGLFESMAVYAKARVQALAMVPVMLDLNDDHDDD